MAAARMGWGHWHHNGSAWVHAIGWVLVFAVLHQQMNMGELTVVLLTLALAEVLARLLLAGSDEGPRPLDGQDMLGRALGRWLALSVLIIALFTMRSASFYTSRPFALVCLIGLLLILVLLKICRICAARAGSDRPGMQNLRMGLNAAVLWGISKLGPLDADVAILAILLTYLLLLLQPLARAMPQLRQPGGTRIQPGPSVIDLLQGGFRNCDLLAIPFLFAREEPLPYLVARGLVWVVPLAVDHLEVSARQSVFAARASNGGRAFVPTMARVNLGLMLVGGAAALLVLAVAEWLQSRALGDMIVRNDLVLWLLLGSCAPMIFGATRMLTSVTQMRRDAALLQLGGMLLFVGLLAVSEQVTLLALARSFGLMQIGTIAAISALLAYSEGVWPGLTALFFRQIRLWDR